eukprot:GHVS01102085.1.p1 GENE.GHVS01102085.1~~GHVS01102085.1.p1  ORF type:complete len:166 (+),score=15.47 GHVS01102085.1:60-557(+)
MSTTPAIEDGATSPRTEISHRLTNLTLEEGVDASTSSKVTIPLPDKAEAASAEKGENKSSTEPEGDQTPQSSVPPRDRYGRNILQHRRHSQRSSSAMDPRNLRYGEEDSKWIPSSSSSLGGRLEDPSSWSWHPPGSPSRLHLIQRLQQEKVPKIFPDALGRRCLG